MLYISNGGIQLLFIIQFAAAVIAGSVFDQTIFSISFFLCIFIELQKKYVYEDAVDSIVLLVFGLGSICIFFHIYGILTSTTPVAYSMIAVDSDQFCMSLNITSMQEINAHKKSKCNIDSTNRLHLLSRYNLLKSEAMKIFVSSSTNSTEYSMSLATCASVNVDCYELIVDHWDVDHVKVLRLPMQMIHKFIFHNTKKVYSGALHNMQSIQAEHHSIAATVHDNIHVHFDSIYSGPLLGYIDANVNENIFFVAIRETYNVPTHAEVQTRLHASANTRVCEGNVNNYKDTLSLFADSTQLSTTSLLSYTLGCGSTHDVSCIKNIPLNILLHIYNIVNVVIFMLVVDACFNKNAKRNVLNIFIVVILVLSMNYVVVLLTMIQSYNIPSYSRVLIIVSVCAIGAYAIYCTITITAHSYVYHYFDYWSVMCYIIPPVCFSGVLRLFSLVVLLLSSAYVCVCNISALMIK